MMKRICKVVTCGDVDSGKSTLLGRLLYNTDNVYEDQKQDVEKASKKYSLEKRLEYGLLLDGLLEERKQQITIDVSHRYFNIRDTRFHLLDCPGHYEYTHNFVIAATEADIAILVIDSTKGLKPQTINHYTICKDLKIKKIIFAVTKIDLINENKLQYVISSIKSNINEIDYKIITTSAVENINVNELADILYDYSVYIDENKDNLFAMTVQDVKSLNGKRVYQGISYGEFFENVKKVNLYPSKIECNLSKVDNSVELYKIQEDIDISRGYIFANFEMNYSKIIKGKLIRFNKEDISLVNLLFKYGTKIVKIKKMSNEDIEFEEEIPFCNIETFKKLGFGLIIDNMTKQNFGIFIITNNEYKSNNYCYWFTGYSGSGKTTLAKALSKFFAIPPIILDGDEVRKTINYDLTLSDDDRNSNVKKIANLAKLLNSQGFNVIVACISKDLCQREYARNILQNSYVEVFIDSSDKTRRKRDTKNLYKNNIKPLNNYEKSPWEYITINTDFSSVEDSVVELILKLKSKNLF